MPRIIRTTRSWSSHALMWDDFGRQCCSEVMLVRTTSPKSLAGLTACSSSSELDCGICCWEILTFGLSLASRSRGWVPSFSAWNITMSETSSMQAAHRLRSLASMASCLTLGIMLLQTQHMALTTASNIYSNGTNDTANKSWEPWRGIRALLSMHVLCLNRVKWPMIWEDH